MAKYSNGMELYIMMKNEGVFLEYLFDFEPESIVLLMNLSELNTHYGRM